MWVLMFVTIVSASAYGLITTQGNVTMSTPAYNITLIPTLNSTSMSSDGTTLTIGVNTSTLKLNSSNDFSLSNVSYLNDKMNFTINASSGVLNISAKMLNNKQYSLIVDNIKNITSFSNSSGWIDFNYSSWSQHDFSVVSGYNISGYVNDTLGSPISSVFVVNGTSSTTTNVTGYYLISSMSNGTYNFSYSKAGHITRYKDITITGADVVNQNVTLTPFIDVYAFNSTANDYTNDTTYSVHPNQGILVYSTINFTWKRSTI